MCEVFHYQEFLVKRRAQTVGGSAGRWLAAMEREVFVATSPARETTVKHAGPPASCGETPTRRPDYTSSVRPATKKDRTESRRVGNMIPLWITSVKGGDFPLSVMTHTHTFSAWKQEFVDFLLGGRFGGKPAPRGRQFRLRYHFLLDFLPGAMSPHLYFCPLVGIMKLSTVCRAKILTVS